MIATQSVTQMLQYPLVSSYLMSVLHTVILPRRTDNRPMSDDHSGVEPPLPIPNRSVKRSSADDSAIFFA